MLTFLFYFISFIHQLYFHQIPEYSTYKWPKLNVAELKPKDEGSFYKYGDVLKFHGKNDNLEVINIPTTFTGSSCVLMEPLKFLETKTIECLKSVNDLCSFNSNLLLHLQSLSTTSKMKTGFNIKTCDRNLGNCSEASHVEAIEVEGDELFDEIKILFEIKGASLVSVNITMFCSSDLFCGYEEFFHQKVIQTIDIKFNDLNENRTRQVKNLRGYETGKSILVSRLRLLNESNIDQGSIFDYFHNDTKNNSDIYLKVPQVREGNCVLAEDVYDEIRFNENIQIVCLVMLHQSENSNETCQQNQRQIMHHLFNPFNLTANSTQDLFISRYWSPSYDKWTKIILLNAPSLKPQLSDEKNSFVCEKLVTFVKYSIYSSRVKTTKNKYENVIDDVRVEFSSMPESQMKEQTQNNQTVEVTIQVQFFISQDNS